MRKAFILLLSILMLSCSNQNKTSQTLNMETEKMITDLIASMTLKEKIGQMSQMNYHGDTISEKFRQAIRDGLVGSFLNVDKPGFKDELQKIAMEESRLKIPLIYGRDVIHGFRTIFPIPVGQSCSWNPELVEQAARVSAKEASAEGYHWTFAPMIDITRNPKWGRVAETTGEDPYLTSQFARAMVRGFQGDNLSDKESIAACAKHFAGYGETEDGKDYNTTWVPMEKMLNVILPPFKAACEEGVATFMSAFNDINGVPAAGHHWLMRTMLKGAWGFEGFVVSDWDGITQMINQGFCENEKEAALKGLIAGNDMEMHSSSYLKHVEELISEGKIDETLVDDAVRRILRVKFQLGLFETPYQDKGREGDIFSEENLQVAYELSKQSIVLLKNENNTLPLSKDIKKVALIGPLAHAGKDQIGCWAFDSRADDSRTPLMAFQQLLGESRVIFAQGMKNSRDNSKDGFIEAINAAKKADAVVFVAGEENIISGESRCRAIIDLPGVQEELISALKATGKPLVVVIMAGRPLTFEPTASISDALLYMYHPGTMGGPALTDILFGVESPSGKLTTTIPRTVGQVPIYYSHHNPGRPAPKEAEGIPTGDPINPVGYLSYFLDVANSPAFPFGYGLSYTTFEYKDLKLESDSIAIDDSVKISVTIANTGKYDAAEIIQLYIRDVAASITRPVKELKGFNRVFLKKGESKEVTFVLTKKDLGFYLSENEFVTEPGKFYLWLGSSSDDNRYFREFKLY